MEQQIWGSVSCPRTLQLGLGQYSVLSNIAVFAVICIIFHSIVYGVAVTALSCRHGRSF